MENEPIHIGKKIKEVIKARKLTQDEFAKLIGKKSRQNVQKIVARKSIDVQLLKEIGVALDYNFFQHYARIDLPKKDIQELLEMIRLIQAKLKAIEKKLK